MFSPHEDQVLIGPPAASDLHFRSGFLGWSARFFVARRAAGDPADATVVLPCLIFLALVRLSDIGHVGIWTVVPGLAIPAAIAGCWIGACLGMRAQGRVMLRGTLVGALEGAASVALVKETVHQPEALTNTFNLMYINFVLFWFFFLIAATPSDILTQTEQEWQKTVPRRAFLNKFIRFSLFVGDLTGESTGMIIAVRLTQWLWPTTAAAWFAWTFFGISPLAYLRLQHHVGG